MLVDKLTNSIELRTTGQSFATIVTPLTAAEARRLKKADFGFDWKSEAQKTDRQVYKLTTWEEPTVIQGLVSLQVQAGFVFMHLVETATFNQGKQRRYVGVFGNLAAFACKLSFEVGMDGYLVFDAKTALIEHYKKMLGARRQTAIRMYLETNEAKSLVSTYYKDFFSPSSPAS
jgi:hypothetical protein